MNIANHEPTEHLISRRIEIDAAHRVLNHHSKCRNLHGHRYVIEAWCRGPLEDTAADSQEGMVLDFGFLKDEMVATIDEPCDHSAIFSINDPILDTLQCRQEELAQEVRDIGFSRKMSAFGNLYVIGFVPTAENLARHWYQRLRDRVSVRTEARASLELVKVWETPNCWASFGQT